MNTEKLKSIIVRKITRIGLVSNLYIKHKIKQNDSLHLSDDDIVQAEADFDIKRTIVNKYFNMYPARFRDDVEMVSKLMQFAPSLKGEENKEDIRTELLFYRIGYGFHPEEYICYELERYSKEEQKAFLSSRECIVAALRMNDYFMKQILNNKGLTYRKFHRYYKRDAVYLQRTKDYEVFQAFVKKHPVFVKKNVFEAMGRSVALVDIRTCGMSEKEYFESLLRIGPHLLEERVIQSEVMAALHPASVNTVRCITFNTRHGIKDPYYFMKIGQAGAFVDNGGAGGILVGIDNDTGRLNTDGYDELDRKYTVHPDSQIPFIGYQLPDWEQMKAICKELSNQLPTVKYIGWDMAHTDDGWVIIEGNGASQMIGPQTVYKRGCKAEVAALMADMDLIV